MTYSVLVAGLDVVFGPYLGPDDSVLAYLPLAHSFEFAFENACLYWGICMGYGSSKTLTDKSMRNCKGDMKEFRPTILIGVPAIWDTMRKGIEEKVNKGGRLKKKIFWGAMALKSFLMTWRVPGRGLLDALVFKTVKKETGDRLRVCFNGAGPIGEDTRRFLSFALVPLLTGYGLAETTSWVLTSPHLELF
jgi:long-chain acyl-CoA synthetase